MWSRVIEFSLACWLAISLFVFRHGEDANVLWISDFAAAATIATLACLSYWQPTRYAHLLILPLAIWLIVFGRFGAEAPLPGGMQNNIVVGLLLLMFAIVPNDASKPPQIWFKKVSRRTTQPSNG